MEMLWLGLDRVGAAGLDRLTGASEIRRLAARIRPLLGDAGFGTALRNETEYPGESFMPVFMDDVSALLESVGAGAE
jgi:hypothetical protein